MSGRNRLGRGKHWSRQRARSRVYAAVNARLIRALCQLTDHEGSNDTSLDDRRKREGQLQAMRWRLLFAVARARHDQQEAGRRQPTMSDCRRQLRAMLKLDDATLARAVRDCDTATHAAIEAAKSAIWLTSEAQWVPSDEPDATPGAQILAPETIRRSVEIALVNTQAKNAKRGRKEKPYQNYLAHACHKYWSACRPKGAPGRVDFAHAVFEAADWRKDKGLSGFAPENDKNLQRLLRKAAQEAAARKEAWNSLRVMLVETEAGMEVWDRLYAIFKTGRIK